MRGGGKETTEQRRRPSGRLSRKILDLGHKEEKSFKGKASSPNELGSERGHGS